MLWRFISAPRNLNLLAASTASHQKPFKNQLKPKDPGLMVSLGDEEHESDLADTRAHGNPAGTSVSSPGLFHLANVILLQT